MRSDEEVCVLETQMSYYLPRSCPLDTFHLPEQGLGGHQCMWEDGCLLCVCVCV